MASSAAEIRRVAAGRRLEIVYLTGALGGDYGDIAYRNLELIARELKPLVADW